MRKPKNEADDLSLDVDEIVLAFRRYRTLRGLLVHSFKKRHATTSPDRLRSELLPIVGKMYEVGIVESDSNRNKGELTLDRKSPNYEAAKKGLQRLMAEIAGTPRRGV